MWNIRSQTTLTPPAVAVNERCAALVTALHSRQRRTIIPGGRQQRRWHQKRLPRPRRPDFPGLCGVAPWFVEPPPVPFARPSAAGAIGESLIAAIASASP